MKNLYVEAQKFIAGGVDSPVRSFKSTGMDPLFIKKAKGKYIYTENGNKLVDYCLSWGVSILGHADDTVENSVIETVKNGTSFGMPSTLETQLAKKVIERIPSVEKVRFVSSGTEAVMSAVRLARGVTGRDKIVKFDGCYHGHSDSLLVNAGSGVSEISTSSSKGIPNDIVKNTMTVPYNDIDAIKALFKKEGKEIATVLVEPIPGNMGLILPKEGYLETLRELCTAHGALLIFDEVITGLRAGYSGAQGYFGVLPDITTLGKVIGGGFPVGAFGASSEIMEHLAPNGDVYQAGTLSGNPVAMSAGIAVLDQLNSDTYKNMATLLETFTAEFSKETGLYSASLGTMFTLFFSKNRVNNFIDAGNQDDVLFRKIFSKLIEKDILLPPSMYETAFLSTLHNESDLEQIIKVFKENI